MSPAEEYQTNEEFSKMKICVDRPVPEDRIIEAAIKAVEENPNNVPLTGIPAGMGVEPTGLAEMAVLTEKKWKPGRTIRVKFLDGDSDVQQKVKTHAKEWEKHANLRLDFVEDGEAEIRISFQHQGSWSYLGTVALVIDADQPTMNYGWLTPTSAEDEYSRVVLHEFGHALACIHEHQHPLGGIPWDTEKVYRYYQVTQGWSRDKTDRNVLNKYSTDITSFSSFDSASIMQYAVPNELTIGDFSIGWNRDLSETDKEFVATMYPGKKKDAIELRPGQPVEADIGKHGEEDAYWFRIDSAATYAIETRGNTDVVMALFGPDDRTRQIASDDDSGQNFNARIVRTLAPGEYYVRIRHFFSWGTGTYSIRLQEL